ncbi:MAG TPA: YqgE/AlgH family protein [Acidimicrobiales bacterium]|nr:YqgE/AlgH family protein [Acidimicrobiales bacterium]
MDNDWEVPPSSPPAFDPYGGNPPPESLSTHLLVASPRLEDPNFARRVILILEHGEHGALAVVLNKPGGVGVDEVLPEWHPLATPPAELFTGGPVARNAVIGLARLRIEDNGSDPELLAPPEGWRPLIPDVHPVGTIDLAAGPATMTDVILGVRLFSGYAGWDAGQLEGEIDEGSWYVVRAEPGDPVSADPEGLWQRVLRRQGGSLAVVSGYPIDPATN